MLKEFKKFISRGNVLDMAVGVIIGGAFGKIIASLVDDIIMPLIGLSFGSFLDSISFINLHIIASIILIYIGIDLIISNFKEEEKLTITLLGFLMFGLSVSLDSLTVGIGLKAITNNYLESAIVFSLSSFLFTILGLTLGNIIGHKIGAYSKTIGGLILIIISILMLFH